MEMPQNGWKLVAVWVIAVGGAIGMAALGQVTLAATLIGAIAGATVPRSPMRDGDKK